MNLKEAREILDKGIMINADKNITVKDLADHFMAKGFLAGAASRDALIKELVEALERLLDKIDYSTFETLNGKYSAEVYDPDESYILGAHTFFRLIGPSYPVAKKALAKYKDSLKAEEGGTGEMGERLKPARSFGSYDYPR